MIKPELNTDWRKVAAGIYHKPLDSKIFGSVEMDVTGLEEFISAQRKLGLKITLTHIFVLAVGRALREDVPELNCYIKRGNVVYRESVDAMVSVLVNEDQMSSVKVSHADRLSLSELAEILNDKVKELRGGQESRTMQMKGSIARVPWPFRAWVLGFIRFITITMGWSIPRLGISAGNYGSFVLSNIGSIGLDTGFPALFPVSNVAFVLIQGGVKLKPAVVEDRIVPRRILSLSIAMDHRVVDAWHGGKLFRSLKKHVKHPEALLHPVPGEDNDLKRMDAGAD
jgi:pyruvate/2-oxoglutarate dehydrogenase complex dihydrolipoamide acyltransferase (E2) component